MEWHDVNLTTRIAPPTSDRSYAMRVMGSAPDSAAVRNCWARRANAIFALPFATLQSRERILVPVALFSTVWKAIPASCGRRTSAFSIGSEVH
jgi:hypothetical protein